ncbi:hypothetical protein [Paenibacillus pini]|uniref:Uncharacterized protein n=1 Tax=Paenibacillus pini JCM 16418 TaxID=1236976 RepID=W7YQZ2_9BACL|nr:hypothetical protein [Paenibacillus pini]GAF07026.1 hypothetical protein JCM16418_1013 [Paenibacillus pini JCM 16418]
MSKEKIEVKELCVKHVHRYVRVWMLDGTAHDGFVESVDEDKVCLAVPIGHELMPLHHHQHHQGCGCGHHDGYRQGDSRGFYPGYYPPYGGYGYPYGRRRFNRLILPLAGLTALTLLPYF